jgi:hypothetical protein
MKTANKTSLLALHTKLGEVAALLNTIRANSENHAPLQQDSGYSQNLLQDIFNNMNAAFREAGAFDDEAAEPSQPKQFIMTLRGARQRITHIDGVLLGVNSYADSIDHLPLITFEERAKIQARIDSQE